MSILGHAALYLRRRRGRGTSGSASTDRLPFVPRAPTVNPILPVVDMNVSIAFYERLGFDVHRYDDGYAWVRHCGWEFLHLAGGGEVDPASNHAAAYVHVDDPDAWRAAMAAAAPDVDLGVVSDRPWGMREFEFTDPAGSLVRIGTNL